MRNREYQMNNTKSRVLALLSEHRGTHISGETLADTLSVSRNAVWKAIRSLRQEGWRISAVTNKGYCLEEQNDMLTEQGIRNCIGEHAEISRILVYQELVSTNQTAKELALSGAPHGTAVFAEMQTGGRGRFQRTFYSPAGGLYCSVILRPEKLHFQHITAVTAFAACAAADTVEEISGRSPQIKWVNDLYLDGKKICGILTEAVTDMESGGIGWVVVGIGMNLTEPVGGFPADLRDIAGSVFDGTMIPDVRNTAAAGILKHLLPGSPPSDAEIFARYRCRMMMLGKTVTYRQGGDVLSAVAEDIDSCGRLVLRMPDNSINAVSSGEIRLII